MYKALIIDDELSAINSIYSAFDWKRLKVSQVIKINDNSNLCETIQAHQPDIVMIDIEMGDVSGLDIIDECKKAGSKALFVIISGHYNFNYAKTAIKLDAIYFLSKPIMDYDVDEAMEKIIERLNSNVEDKDNMLNDVSLLLSDNKGFCTCLRNNHFDFSLKYRFIITDTNERMLEEIGRLCLGNALCVKYKIGKKKYLFIVKSERFTAYKELRLKSVSATRQVSIGISDEFVGEEGVYECFKQAYLLSFGKFIYAKHDVYKNVPVEKDVTEAFSEKWLEYLEKMGGEIDEFYKTITEIPKYFIEQKFNFKHVIFLHNSLVYKINLLSKSMIYDETVSVLSEEDIVAEYSSLENMCKIFLKIIKEIFSEKTFSVSNDDDMFEKIIKYVNNSYNQNVSLEEIAEKFNVSISYICKHFKRKLNTTFLEYLKTIRISHAKRMLKNSSLSVAEIAEMVGYVDYYYFNRVFKAATGYTPRQYKMNGNG